MLVFAACFRGGYELLYCMKASSECKLLFAESNFLRILPRIGSADQRFFSGPVGLRYLLVCTLGSVCGRPSIWMISTETEAVADAKSHPRLFHLPPLATMLHTTLVLVPLFVKLAVAVPTTTTSLNDRSKFLVLADGSSYQSGDITPNLRWQASGLLSVGCSESIGINVSLPLSPKDSRA